MRGFILILCLALFLTACATTTPTGYYSQQKSDGYKFNFMKNGLVELNYKFTQATVWKDAKALAMKALVDTARRVNKEHIYVYKSFVLVNGKQHKLSDASLFNDRSKTQYNSEYEIKIIVQFVDQSEKEANTMNPDYWFSVPADFLENRFKTKNIGQ
jgi:hypothetical protein